MIVDDQSEWQWLFLPRGEKRIGEKQEKSLHCSDRTKISWPLPCVTLLTHRQICSSLLIGQISPWLQYLLFSSYIDIRAEHSQIAGRFFLSQLSTVTFTNFKIRKKVPIFFLHNSRAVSYRLFDDNLTANTAGLHLELRHKLYLQFFRHTFYRCCWVDQSISFMSRLNQIISRIVSNCKQSTDFRSLS